MATTLRVKPGREGLRVAFPGRRAQPLDPAGELVPLTRYWRRRLAAGDVVEVDAAAAAVEPQDADATPKRGRKAREKDE